jgi:hypothetical protein
MVEVALASTEESWVCGERRCRTVKLVAAAIVATVLIIL